MKASDQAEGLRRMLAGRAPRVIHFVSGAAGAGRTALVSNLAVALAALGREVIVVDENNRLGNACDAFGLRPRYELAHALCGDRPLAEVVLDGPQGVRVLPAARAGHVQGAMSGALARLLHDADFVLVDCARGMAAARAPFAGTVAEVIVPAAAEAAAITETYAWLKQVAARREDFAAQLVIGRALGAEQARAIHANIASVARERLGLELPLLGAIRHDARVAQCALRGQPVCAAHPRTEAAGDFRAIARSLDARRDARGRRAA